MGDHIVITVYFERCFTQIYYYNYYKGISLFMKRLNRKIVHKCTKTSTDVIKHQQTNQECMGGKPYFLECKSLNIDAQLVRIMLLHVNQYSSVLQHQQRCTQKHYHKESLLTNLISIHLRGLFPEGPAVTLTLLNLLIFWVQVQLTFGMKQE